MNVRDWLSNTTASDVMVRDMRTLRTDDSLAKAAAESQCEQIPGAPVVRQSGACVGVLLARNLVGVKEQAAAEREMPVSSNLRPRNIRADACRKTCIVRYWMGPKNAAPPKNLWVDFVAPAGRGPCYAVFSAI